MYTMCIVLIYSELQIFEHSSTCTFFRLIMGFPRSINVILTKKPLYWCSRNGNCRLRYIKPKINKLMIIYLTSRPNGYHSCFLSGRSRVQIFGRRPGILTEILRGFYADVQIVVAAIYNLTP
jgi:hypothetical protein